MLLLRALLWRAVLCTAVVLVLLHWKQAIARTISVRVTWVEYAAIAVIFLGVLNFVWSAAIRTRRWARQLRRKNDHALATVARKHLSRVRYLQTYTSGWSGTLQLPWGKTQGQYSHSVAQAEQPHSYPEIVDEFRNFARDVAAEVHLQHNRVFIGIDELSTRRYSVLMAMSARPRPVRRGVAGRNLRDLLVRPVLGRLQRPDPSTTP